MSSRVCVSLSWNSRILLACILISRDLPLYTRTHERIYSLSHSLSLSLPTYVYSMRQCLCNEDHIAANHINTQYLSLILLYFLVFYVFISLFLMSRSVYFLLERTHLINKSHRVVVLTACKRMLSNKRLVVDTLMRPHDIMSFCDTLFFFTHE